jgi:hypothetical protein
MNRRQFVLACLSTPPLLREYITAQAQNSQCCWLGKPSAGQVVNLARCGQIRSWLNPEIAGGLQQQSGILRLISPQDNKLLADIGFEWPEFRTVREVMIRFAANPPEESALFLEYWDGLTSLQGCWKAFEQGLANGNHLDIQGRQLTYRFQERRTCKVRLRSAGLRHPEIEEFAIHGRSIWKAGSIRVEWGHAKNGPWDGQIESYNGEILSINPIGSFKLDGANRWKSRRGEKSGLAVFLLYASGMDVDRSILTIRSQNGDCSFLSGEAVEGEAIDIVDYGIYVRNKEYQLDQAAYRSQNQGKSRVIDAVAREKEQSLENAYANIKARRVTLSFVGAEANNQKFGIAPDGHIVVGNNDPLAGDPIIPSFAVYFDTAEQPFIFQTPPSASDVFVNEGKSGSWVIEKEQNLKEGWLPIIETRWSKNNLDFERKDFGTLLHQVQAIEKTLGNEPAVLISRLRIRNSSPTNELATYFIRPWKPAGQSRFPFGPIPADVQEGWTTVLRDDLVIASASGGDVLVSYVDAHQKGSLSLDTAHNAVRYEVRLGPGEEHVIHTVIPGWEPSPQVAPLVRGLDYDQLETAASKYWKDRAAPSMSIEIPDVHLQNLFNATLQHFLLGLTKNGNKDECYPNVAMLYYGSIGSESSPIIRALDMRGMHKVAERCLEAFLSTQSEFAPEGDYDSKEGGFYRFWPIYTVDQGGVLWALADHYRFTRDNEWLRRVAPKIISGCEFIARERKRTKTLGPSGAKPLHYGLAPAGCVADPRDWQYSFMLNAWFYAGLKNCAEVLNQVDPAKAHAFEADAADYKECILRAFKESVAISPVTRLLDNTSVPSAPPYLGLRGFSTDVKDSVDPDRRHGYAYDCTIGPFHLFNCGVLEANDPMVTAMLNYFEDRFFLATPLPSRVELDRLAVDKFNLGGFEKLQPYYVHYQEAYLRRDQIPNFLRGFYNTLATTADPQTLTFQEELDFGGGQPHKTHEEGWFFHQLREMLVMEAGTTLNLAHGTPRDWLKGGQKIGIQHAPTYFGPVSYQIQSSPDLQTITADVELPVEIVPSTTILRIRHPTQKPLKKVTINGRTWAKFDAEKERIELPQSGSKHSLVAYY